MSEKPKRKTYTSTAVKTRWNNKHYDRVTLIVPKGQKDVLADYCKANGKSVNGYLNDKIRELLGVSPEDWKPKLEE